MNCGDSFGASHWNCPASGSTNVPPWGGGEKVVRRGEEAKSFKQSVTVTSGAGLTSGGCTSETFWHPWKEIGGNDEKRPKLIDNWKIGDTDWSTKDEDRYCPSLSLWTRRWSAVTRPPEAVLQKLISRQICEMSRTALTFKSFVRVLYGRGLCWWMFLFLHDQGPNSSQTLE